MISYSYDDVLILESRKTILRKKELIKNNKESKMNIKVLSDNSETVVYRTRVLNVDKFTVTEKYKDDILTDQIWSVKGGFKKTHQEAYEPSYMHFDYYEDISFLDSEECYFTDKFREQIPNRSFVLDWDLFKKEDLNKVLCIYINMDGNIYRINNPKPVLLWRKQEYIGGFRNDVYDLEKLFEIFTKISWMRNVKIIDIPYYNVDTATKAIEFEYKSSSNKLIQKLKKLEIGDETFMVDLN